jgi:hypothetical protein
MVESESLAGVVEDMAYTYRVPLVPSRGQTSDSLAVDVALLARDGYERVLYFGDLDFSGAHIEDALRAKVEALARVELDWRRVALTEEQVAEHHLTVIRKYDGRGHGSYHDAVETEALDQRILLPLVEQSLSEMLPSSALDDVSRREKELRKQAVDAVREQLGAA